MNAVLWRRCVPLLVVTALAACDPAPRALLYNHSGHTVRLANQTIPAGRTWSGIWIDNGQVVSLAVDGKTLTYPMVATPPEYRGASLATREYLLELRTDLSLAAIRHEDEAAVKRGAGARSPQPPGFPLQPLGQ